jgi:hypothetical protein
MEIASNLNAVLSPAQTTAPVLERAVTTKVVKLESTDRQATLPSDRPYIAQAVAARLEGGDYPDPPSEIAPPERTLRPYDVPMLPFETPEEKGEPLDMASEQRDRGKDDR